MSLLLVCAFAGGVVVFAAIAVMRMRILKMENGELRVTLSRYGASLLSVKWRGIEMTINDGIDEFYFGCIVGPVAGRIRNARISIEDENFQLQPNCGAHLLHGGEKGWSRRRWAVESRSSTRTVFALEHPDDGFPGRRRACVTYEVSGSTLSIGFECRSDSPSRVSLTNHAYWNLNGDRSKIDNHVLYVKGCSQVVEVDDELVPTGRLVPATNSFLKRSQKIGDSRIDNTFVGEEVEATLEGSRARIVMKTTQPALHIYTANFLPTPRIAVCLETQHGSPGILVEPNAPYSHLTTLRFEL